MIETIRRPRVEADPGLRRTYAPEPTCDVATGEFDLVDRDSDRVVAFCRVLPREDVREIRRGLLGMRWDGMTESANEFRLSGIKNAHRTFGFSEPVPLRRRYGCSRCRLTEEFPALDRALDEIVGPIHDLTLDIAPATVGARHGEIREAVDPGWRLGRTAWTAGILNYTAALPYHRDAGNFVGGWSTMLVLRRWMEGGLLHLVEYDLAIGCEDRALVGFDGQAIMHGVTPLAPDRRAHTAVDPYRFSVVWYSKRGMVKCAPPGEAELARTRAARTAAEDRIAREWT